MVRAAFLSLLVVILSASPAFAARADWDSWSDALARQCPSRHVDWICDGCYDQILDGFERTLPTATRHRIARIADMGRRCAHEIAGLSCEMSASLRAYNRLGLMPRFVAYGCRHFRCTEPVMCTGPGDKAA